MSNGNTYKQEKYKEIVEEQIAMGYASQNLSFQDTDEMCPYDRKIALASIQKIRDAENEAKNKAIGTKKQSRRGKK